MRRRVCGGALSAIGLLGVLVPATASAAVPCRPLNGIRTHDVATAPRLAGAETTQYLTSGGSNLGCTVSARAIVLACMVATTADGVHFSGIDLRFTNARGVWSLRASPPANRFDLWSVAAHESGHAIGLGHADADFLTMYASTAAGQIRQRDLGLGDAVGLRCRYGVTVGGC